eukprot:EG_transcript_59050
MSLVALSRALSRQASVFKKSAPAQHCVRRLASIPTSYANAVADATGALDVYAERASIPEPPLLREVRETTKRAFPASHAMLSGHLQGRLLKTLTIITGAKAVLELGT